MYNHCELSILVEIAFVCGDLVVHGPKSQASWVIGFSARLHVGPCVMHVALLVLVPGPQVVEHLKEKKKKKRKQNEIITHNISE